MQAQKPSAISHRLVIHQSTIKDEQNQLAADVRSGLTSNPKTLPPKYFYDALGSQLFEAICQLPEYYLTRAETEIFEHYATEIAAQSSGPVSVIELGSGSSVKTRLLIEAILARQPELHYQPIDISATILEQSASKLLGDYPKLRITAQVSDYTRGLGSIARQDKEKIMVLFLGSNIGNYTPEEALLLLSQIRHTLRAGDSLLLGADLRKPADRILPAYNDALGITAAFNRNLLLRINRELQADFDLNCFEHLATYNEAIGRIEIYLVSRKTQTVNIDGIGLRVEFQEGETIHTENSYKYAPDQLATLAEESGFKSLRIWFDAKKRFGCTLWRAE
jgi:dimethylhistidine N-methyltransferase